MKEIEHKYLVHHEIWKDVDKGDPELIVQGYLHSTEECTVRVRITGSKGYLTIKGETIGITRPEFEYEIPISEANEIIDLFVKKVIRKKRYKITHEGLIWEVDVFEGKLEGLIVAELEVESENTIFNTPHWVSRNVSNNPAYYNAILIEKC